MGARTWTILLLLAIVAPAAARGQDAGGSADDAYPLVVRVGQLAAICTTDTILCPAAAPICDDPSVATGVDSEQGLAFKGMRPGTTLCSAQSSAGLGPRRVYRITVTE